MRIKTNVLRSARIHAIEIRNSQSSRAMNSASEIRLARASCTKGQMFRRPLLLFWRPPSFGTPRGEPARCFCQLIRSTIDGQRALYQESAVASLRTPRDLIRKHTGADTFGLAPQCIAARRARSAASGPAPASRWSWRTPCEAARCAHAYDIKVLPVVS
jgi:hypothetical protein